MRMICWLYVALDFSSFFDFFVCTEGIRGSSVVGWGGLLGFEFL